MTLLPETCAAAIPVDSPTAIEAEVAAIWADVLELDAVRPDDDFFELGGDSLSAVQILTRISRRFNYKVTEVELFTARTVRGLCQVVEQASWVHAKAALSWRPSKAHVPGSRR